MDAKVTLSYNGQQGDLAEPVDFDASDTQIRAMLQEALRGGDIPGIDADPNADLTNFVVDRFPPKDELGARLSLRPKVPFGAKVLALNSMSR